jgi:hypothetical protein
MGVTNNTSTPSTGGAADWESLKKTYDSLQRTAYTTQGVKSKEVTALKEQMDAYITAHVTDAVDQKSKLRSIDDSLGAMLEATDKHASSGKTSNQSWDISREALEDVLDDLVPEGSDEVWTPTEMAEVGSGSAAPKFNSHVKLDGPAGVAAPASSKDGLTMVSLDEMVRAFPALKPYQADFEAAGKAYNVPPQLLAAQAMQESHANTDAGANGNIMQFTNVATWNSMHTGIDHSQISASNIPQQIMAAARYDADLFNKHNDWDAALREYNGPIGQGGTPEYQANIRRWLIGKDGYGHD